MSTPKFTANFDSANCSKTTSPILSVKSFSSTNLSVLPLEKKKSDFIFEERNLRVTKEDIENDIPVGSARSKIDIFRKFENIQKSNKLLEVKKFNTQLRKTHSLAKLYEADGFFFLFFKLNAYFFFRKSKNW